MLSPKKTYTCVAFHRASRVTRTGVPPGIWHDHTAGPGERPCPTRTFCAPKPKKRFALESCRRDDPTRTWGGPGVGAPCTVCGEPITKDQLEFEVQFARDGDNPGLDKFHIHVRCFAAWEFERVRDGRPHS
jgi:hypothetical protein